MKNISKLIYLYNKNINFKDTVDFFIDNPEIKIKDEVKRFEMMFEIWKKNKNFMEINVNKEFILSFLPSSTEEIIKEKIINAIVFLFLTTECGRSSVTPRDTAWSLGVTNMETFMIEGIPFPLTKKLPSTSHFIFHTSSIDEVLKETNRIRNFFKEEIKEFISLLEEAKKISNRLSEIINTLVIEEEKELEKKAPEILKENGVWEWFETVNLPSEMWPADKKKVLTKLYYIGLSPYYWAKNLEEVKKILEENGFLTKK
jgi:hypothetical protein